jgi:hypothetical protein
MQRSHSMAHAPAGGKRKAEAVPDEAADSPAMTPRHQLLLQQQQQHAEHVERLARMACEAARALRCCEEEKKLRLQLQKQLDDAMTELAALRKARLRKGARTGH